jgi:hypothetical protein
MTKTAILIGNGTFDARIKNYKNYVDEFAEFANTNKIDRVIISGGHTDSDSRYSEASSIKQYLAPKLNKRIKVLTESKSITASQCIRNSKPILRLKQKDDVTVFCDSVIAVKVMWFIMHYWFGMSRKQIERDALNFISTHYSKRNHTETIGKWIGVTGVLYKNVEVHPCFIKPSVHSAIAQQLISLVDTATLYDPKLYREFVDSTKKRYGLRG